VAQDIEPSEAGNRNRLCAIAAQSDQEGIANMLFARTNVPTELTVGSVPGGVQTAHSAEVDVVFTGPSIAAR